MPYPPAGKPRNTLAAALTAAEAANEHLKEIISLLDTYSGRMPLQLIAAERGAILEHCELAQRDLTQAEHAFEMALEQVAGGLGAPAHRGGAR